MTVQKGGWDFFQEGKAAMGDASGNPVTDSSGNPAGNTIVSNTYDKFSPLESGILLFDAEADGVATSAGTFTPVTADVFEISGFSSGVNRMRLKYHYELSTTVTQGPVVPFILITLSDTAANAAAAFAVSTATIKGTAFTTHGSVRVLSPQNPMIEYSLEKSTIDFSNANAKVFGVAVANSATGVDEVMLSWEAN